MLTLYPFCSSCPLWLPRWLITVSVFISLIRLYIRWDQRSDLLFLWYLPELRSEPQAQTGRKPIADLIQLSTWRMTNPPKRRFRSCVPGVPEGPPGPRQIKALVIITGSCYLPFSPSSSHECASEFYRGCVTSWLTRCRSGSKHLAVFWMLKRFAEIWNNLTVCTNSLLENVVIFPKDAIYVNSWWVYYCYFKISWNMFLSFLSFNFEYGKYR